MILKPETKQALLDLADKIEKVNPKNFDMQDWALSMHLDGPDRIGLPNLNPSCGTSCCIAGWHHVFKGRFLEGARVYDSFDAPDNIGYADSLATSDLGLDDYDAHKLFYPLDWPTEDEDIQYYSKFENTPAGAAARIRHFVETGE